MNSFSKCRNSIHDASLKYPSAVLLAGLLAGIIPVVAEGTLNINAVFFSVSALLAAFSALKPLNAAKFSLFLILGAILSAWEINVPDNNFAAADMPPDFACQIKAEVIDPSCVSFKENWLPEPSYIRLHVRQMRYSSDEAWKNIDGETIMKLPYEDRTKHVDYGDELLLKGQFMAADEALFDGGFDYSRFLFYKGIYRVFNTDEISISGSSDSIYKRILKFRDLMILELVKDVKDDENKMLLCSLIFGPRQALDWKSKQSFIRSGTIHIFAVSGLQVGILAVIFFWIFRFIPYRTRHFLLPPMILVYAAMTGMESPVMRAFIMISAWALCRGFLYFTPPLNVVFMSASILLVWNPFYVTDIGFQYTFVIVAFLILSCEYFKRWYNCISETVKWLPESAARSALFRRNHWKTAVISTLATCLVAWIAGIGISAAYQGLYVPFAIPANIVISPLITLVFCLAVLKLVISPLFIFSIPLAYLISLIFDCVNAVSDFFAANYDFCIARPPAWTLILLYAALFSFLAFQNRKIFFASLATLCAVLAFWNIRQDFKDDELIVFYGGRNRVPAILICSYPSREALLLNAPSGSTARSAANFLMLNGINRLETLFIARNVKDFCAGAPYMLSAFRVSELVLSAENKRSTYSKKLLDAAKLSGVSIREGTIIPDEKKRAWKFDSSLLSSLSDENGFTVDYRRAGTNLKIRFSKDSDGSASLEIALNAEEKYIIPLENINRTITKRLKFNEKKS